MNRKVVLFLSAFAALMPILVLAQDTGDGTTTPLDSLSTFALWGIASGIIGTFIVAVINRTHWASDVKFAAFFLWCVAAAAVDAYFKRELDLANWSRALILIFLVGQATYIAAKPAIKTVEVRTG